jgi:hypothetical protein
MSATIAHVIALHSPSRNTSSAAKMPDVIAPTPYVMSASPYAVAPRCMTSST